MVKILKIILATMVIYAAGVLTGALIVRSNKVPSAHEEVPPWVFRGPDFVQQRFLERLKKEVNLTPEQAQRLGVIFRESRDRMNGWWEIIGPEMRAEVKEVKDKIRAQLNAEQWAQFEHLLKDYRRTQSPPGAEKRPRDRRPPGTPDGPPRNSEDRSNQPPSR